MHDLPRYSSNAYAKPTSRGGSGLLLKPFLALLMLAALSGRVAPAASGRGSSLPSRASSPVIPCYDAAPLIELSSLVGDSTR